MAYFDKISIDDTSYNVRDTDTANIVQQQGQTIQQQGQTIQQQGQTIQQIETALSGIPKSSAWIIPTDPPPDSGLAPCVGDARTDDGPALQAMINYCAEHGYGLFLNKLFRTSITLDLPSKTTISGLGISAINYDVSRADDYGNIPSGILYTGTSAALRAEKVSSLNLSSFSVLGTTTDGSVSASKNATYLFYLERVRSSVFYNMRFSFGLNGIGLFANNPEQANDNTMWCVFNGLTVERVTSGVVLNGNMTGSTASNACHNTFIGCNIDTYDQGFVFGNSDNNAVYDCYWFGRGGSPYAVELREGAYGNYFYHMQGRFYLNNNDGYNMVFGYDTMNNQDAPYCVGSNVGRLMFTLPQGVIGISSIGGTRLFCDETAYNALGDFMLGNAPGNSSIIISSNPSSGSPWGWMYLNNERHSLGNLG